MNKLEEIEQAVKSLPNEFILPQNVLQRCLDNYDLGTMRAITYGMLLIARDLTSDDKLLDPLHKIYDRLS